MISIIIPIYNIEQYVSTCVESVLAQTYGDIEIILVEDGSTDNSGRICDEFASLDNRIKVIHKNNGGLSSARNAGIDIAAGEYIYFVDGDDLIHPQCIERLLDCINRYEADIAVCKTNSFLDEKSINYNVIGNSVIASTGEEMCRRLLYGLNDSGNVIAWNKLYKRELFEDVRYPEGLVYEDVATTHELYWKANKVAYLKDELAFYRSKRKGSITHSDNKKYRDLIIASQKRIAFFEINCPLLAMQCQYLLCNEYTRIIKETKDPVETASLKREQGILLKKLLRGDISIGKKILAYIATNLPFIWLSMDRLKRIVHVIKTWKRKSISALSA